MDTLKEGECSASFQGLYKVFLHQCMNTFLVCAIPSRQRRHKVVTVEGPYTTLTWREGNREETTGLHSF